MKASLSKITSLAAGIMLALALTLTGCTEDPANNNSGGGGIDDNGQQQGGGDPSGGGGTNYTISELTIKNSTGYTINGIYVKPSTSTDWGSNLYGYSNLADGQSRKLTFSKHLSATNGLDVQLKASSGGYTFTKYKVTVSNGATVTFTASDLNDESNLPSITIQNRTGVSFNAIYIRPSSIPDESSDWGKDYGSLSNNNDKSTSIPIPSSSYTTFDIQMRSSNPANTYTKKNVAISNGMVLTYTSADSDNPLIGSPIIVLQNNTGYTVNGIYIKPSTSTDWGSNLYGYSNLADGKSRTFTLSQSLSANSVYDIQLKTSSGGYTFTKYNFTVSEGIIITFTPNDLNDGSNLPSVTIQNWSGINFNAIYVKPSESSDWGDDYGSLSNNSDKSITIPIPPSNYTVFDIQARSSNPTNTYTKKNVTISNGMILTYTSADSDNPLIGSPVIVLKNNTGYTVNGIYIKPSTSTDWGSNLYGYSNLADGQSRTFTLSQSLSANSVYDIQLKASSGGYTFTKYDVTVSEGIIINFTSSDLE